MAGEKAKGMTGIHDKGLLIRHCGKVLHCEAVLGPVLEDCAVAAVDDELMRVLGHTLVQIVLDHGHDGRSLPGFGGVLIYRARVYLIGRPIPVHVDAAVILELLCELRGKVLVKGLGEVPEGVFEGQHLFLRAQDVLALWSVVDIFVIGLWLWQFIKGYSCQYLLCKI